MNPEEKLAKDIVKLLSDYYRSVLNERIKMA